MLSFSLSIIFFPNTVYFSILLIFFSILFLIYLSSSFLLSSLVYIIIIIVYVGAIIILIGYICAVCPNVSFYSSSFSFIHFFLLLILYFISYLNPVSFSGSLELTNFFYSTYGWFLFVVIILSLFITLLIVTSQFVSPNGPFRSSS